MEAIPRFSAAGTAGCVGWRAGQGGTLSHSREIAGWHPDDAAQAFGGPNLYGDLWCLLYRAGRDLRRRPAHGTCTRHHLGVTRWTITLPLGQIRRIHRAGERDRAARTRVRRSRERPAAHLLA